MTHSIIGSISALLLPATCMGCAMRCSIPPLAGVPMCADCLAGLSGPAPRCGICAHRSLLAVCPRCRRNPPAFDRTIALADYKPPLDRIIHALKYRGELSLARGLGALLAGRLDPAATVGLDPAEQAAEVSGSAAHRHGQTLAFGNIGRCADDKPVLTAVPLAPGRLLERGFNQALEIARAVGRARGVRLVPGAIRRLRWEMPQARLSPDSRRTHTQDAFEADPRRVAGRAVWVVDDVITTGATLEAVAVALKRAGATSVTNLVIARTSVDHVQRRPGSA
jgi:ComF family protein